MTLGLHNEASWDFVSNCRHLAVIRSGETGAETYGNYRPNTRDAPNQEMSDDYYNTVTQSTVTYLTVTLSVRNIFSTIAVLTDNHFTFQRETYCLVYTSGLDYRRRYVCILHRFTFRGTKVCGQPYRQYAVKSMPVNQYLTC